MQEDNEWSSVDGGGRQPGAHSVPQRDFDLTLGHIQAGTNQTGPRISAKNLRNAARIVTIFGRKQTDPFNS